MSIPLDYETLRIIWWLLLGVLLIGFAVMDGFDLGTAMLLPFVARQRRRAPRHHQRHRAVLGRQSGVAHSRRRRGVRGLAAGLCGVVLRLLHRDVSGAGGADRAPGRVRVPQQNRRCALARVLGLRACSPAGSFPAWCSASPSAICCRAFPSASIAICASSTRAADCGNCSIRSACCAAWCRPRCSPPTAPSI